MKMVNLIAILGVFAIGTGCESARDQESNAVVKPASSPAPTYTVELLPNPQLSPTSREGDKSGVVYSSNIVAVYLNTNGTSPGLTNAPAAKGSTILQK
jgi:hypothetical protein